MIYRYIEYIYIFILERFVYKMGGRGGEPRGGRIKGVATWDLTPKLEGC